MADIKISGVNETMLELKKANLLDDEETLKEILFAGAEILAEEIKKRMDTSGFAVSGYKNSITYDKKVKRTKSGNPYVSVYARGKNSQEEPRGLVLFVLNYGRSAEYGEITGTYFWSNATKAANDLVEKTIEKICTQKLKERGLL